MKTCFKCKTEKPLTDFYRHSAMGDGHLNKCKSCAKVDVWNHRHGENREKVLTYDRARAKEPARKEKAKVINQRWLEKFPERRRAHILVGNAIAGGRLIKWPVCFMPDCQKKPEAHHPDYSRPLDVVWLCAAHHRAAHNMDLD